MKRFLCLLATLAACTGGSGPAPDPGEPMPERDEIALGEELFAFLLQELDGPYGDSQLAEYVGAVGRRVAAAVQKHYPRPLEYRFHIANTSGLNAYALLGGHITLTRGLIAALENEDELVAVLCHAAVHIAARHAAREASTLLPSRALAGAAADIRAGRHRTRPPAECASTWLALSQLANQLPALSFSPSHEEQTDAYTLRLICEIGANPQALVTLFQRLLDRPTGFARSHSLEPERVQALERRIARYHPEDARRPPVTEPFERAVAKLRAEQTAYRHFDRGLEAMRAKNWTAALEEFNSAFAAKKDPLFLIRRGEARLHLKNTAEAETDFAQATRLNDRLFRGWRNLGYARHHLGRFAEAVEALERAVRILPHAEAYFYMGEACERLGNFRAAKDAYTTMLRLTGFTETLPPPTHADERSRRAWERLQVLKDY